MIGFLQDYGLWIALAGVFFAMQWFGMGCCGHGRHRHGATPTEGAPPIERDSNDATPAVAGETSAQQPKGGCH